MQAILVPVSGDVATVDVDYPADWRSLSKAIGADCVEHVRCPLLEPLEAALYVDEEGMVTGRPVNRLASMLYAGPSGIVGNALICSHGMTEDGPDVVDMPTRTRDAVLVLLESLGTALG